LLHPSGGWGGEWQGVKWSEIAERLSKPFDPDPQFRESAGDGDLYDHVLGDIAPLAGSPPFSLLGSLETSFQRWSDDEEPCWFAMWDGNGTWWKGAHGGDDRSDDERDSILKRTPRVRTQSRNYFLMRGPLRAVLPLFDS